MIMAFKYSRNTAKVALLILLATPMLALYQNCAGNNPSAAMNNESPEHHIVESLSDLPETENSSLLPNYLRARSQANGSPGLSWQLNGSSNFKKLNDYLKILLTNDQYASEGDFISSEVGAGNGKKKVTLGALDDATGLIVHLNFDQGFDRIADPMKNWAAGNVGGGWQSTIWSAMHKHYVVSSAGTKPGIGAPVNLSKTNGSIMANQNTPPLFTTPRFDFVRHEPKVDWATKLISFTGRLFHWDASHSDNYNSDQDLIAENEHLDHIAKEVRSEFDFSSIVSDASSSYQIPSFMKSEYFVYSHPPRAISQWLGGALDIGGDAVFREEYRMQFLSPGLSEADKSSNEFRAKNSDLSFSAINKGGLRLRQKEFRYLHYGELVTSANGSEKLEWRILDLVALQSANNDEENFHSCGFDPKPKGLFNIYRDGKVGGEVIDASSKIRNLAGQNCRLAHPVVMISNSKERDEGTAVGLYIPYKDGFNRNQTVVFNKNSQAILRQEDRRFSPILMGAILRSGYDGMEAGYGYGDWIWLNAKEYLSGLHSPVSAGAIYEPGALEMVTMKSVFLFGTPHQIFQAVRDRKGR